MRIQHNIPAMNSYRNYSNNVAQVSKNLEKLSTGYKINRAGDDAAGLAISEKMRIQITGLDKAQENAKSGISLIQTAEGALTEVHDMLNRMFELAEQSANGTFDDSVDRNQLQKEVVALRDEIDRIADGTNYNGIKLLDGSLAGGAAQSGKAVLTGSNVASTQAAELSLTQTLKTNLSGKIVTTDDDNGATKDYLSIDGEKVTIDWLNDDDAKKLAGQLTADLTNASGEALEDIASKLQDVINNSAKAQGVSGTVTVTVDDTGMMKIRSNNKDVDSEFSYLGNSAKVQANVGKGVMTNLISGGGADTKLVGAASINNATLTYNGKDIKGNESFNMTINGTTLNVTVPMDTTTTNPDGSTSTTKGTLASGTAMDKVATAVQKSIKQAVKDYNTQLGLKKNDDGAKNSNNALVAGLDDADFSVTVGDNGNLVVKYSGDEDVEFSFSDVGERTTASALGLTTGTSRNGGAGGLTLQIGDTAEEFNQLTVSVNDCHALALGINSVDISKQGSAQKAMDAIKAATNYISDVRGGLGALQNRLDHTINNLSVAQENIQDAESVIRDVDVADEMMAYTKNNILVQSAQAMLAQANQLPQGVLQLLG